MTADMKAESDRLKAALEEIDRIAYSHAKGGIAKAQQVARSALGQRHGG